MFLHLNCYVWQFDSQWHSGLMIFVSLKMKEKKKLSSSLMFVCRSSWRTWLSNTNCHIVPKREYLERLVEFSAWLNLSAELHFCFAFVCCVCFNFYNNDELTTKTKHISLVSTFKAYFIVWWLKSCGEKK